MQHGDKKSPYKRFVTMTGLAASCLVAAACAGTPPVPASTEPAEARLFTVAVLPFENSTISPIPELSGLEQTIGDAITEGLIGQPGLKLVDRDAIDKVLQELSLGGRALTDPATRLEIGKLLGARYLILGGYTAFGKTLRMDARIVEVETGIVVDALTQTGPVDARRRIETTLSRAVSDALTTKAGNTLTATPISSDDFFKKGLALEKQNRPDQALKAYQKALSLDPGHQQARDRMETLLLKEME